MVILEIYEGTKKCCAACFNRLNRKIAQVADGNALAASSIKNENENSNSSSPAAGSGGSGTPWNDDEIEIVKASLRSSGRNWAVMSQKLNGSKSGEQCKKFFYSKRKVLQLDKIVLDFKRVRNPQALFIVQSFLTLLLECFRRIKRETSHPLCLPMKSPDPRHPRAKRTRACKTAERRQEAIRRHRGAILILASIMVRVESSSTLESMLF